MSFKYQAERISDYEWLLTKGVSKPISVFMSQNLYDASEEGMWQQAIWATTIPSAEKICIVPDSHSGAGVPIGIVVATKDYIAPCAAGFDISCGVASIKTGLNKHDITDKEKRRAWIKAVEERVATGIGGHRAPRQVKVAQNKFERILQQGVVAFDLPNSIKNNFEKTHHHVDAVVKYDKAESRGIPQLGSLGGSNHFCELQQDTDGNVWIMIHTGSRGYGHQIATDFFNEGLIWWNENHPNNQIGRGQKELISFPVESDIGKRYLNAMNQAANFAIVNRYLIALAITEATEEVFKDSPRIFYEISHNLVQYENGLWVHRKGATRAFPAGHSLLKGTPYEGTGHPVLIPGSMGTSSALLMPVDSEKSLYSVNHGCGRVMSRGSAKRTFDQNTVDKEMDQMDILYNTRHVPIDESLHCYKNIDEVLETVEGAGLAKVFMKLYPRAVIKGED